jgi:hypothetical protein
MTRTLAENSVQYFDTMLFYENPKREIFEKSPANGKCMQFPPVHLMNKLTLTIEVSIIGDSTGTCFLVIPAKAGIQRGYSTCFSSCPELREFVF